MRCFAGLLTATLLVLITLCSLASLTTARLSSSGQRCPPCYSPGYYGACRKIPNCINLDRKCGPCEFRVGSTCVRKENCDYKTMGGCPPCHQENVDGDCVKVLPCGPQKYSISFL